MLLTFDIWLKMFNLTRIVQYYSFVKCIFRHLLISPKTAIQSNQVASVDFENICMFLFFSLNQVIDKLYVSFFFFR